MFSITVRDHVMIAHSFRGELFGPAQGLHGATYVVDVQLRRPELDSHGVVVDIGRATRCLKAILGELAYQNLDTLPQFEGVNTTTEYLAKWVFEQMVRKRNQGALGPGSEGLTAMAVTLRESHVAWATYEGTL